MSGLPDNKKPKSDSAILMAYKTHVDALRRFISRFVSKHDVDDVVQEAFMRAYNAETGKPIEQPKSYLFRIAKHVALNQLRQRSRKRPILMYRLFWQRAMMPIPSMLRKSLMI